MAPIEIQEKYVIWRNRVRVNSPGLGGGYKTHKLKGERKGQRAARLNWQWRIIFKVFSHQRVIEALEITVHKYYPN
jgi:mRNA-degrading endonuclease YafQ of YafQ-DinJ toxin-antitoxin module